MYFCRLVTSVVQLLIDLFHFSLTAVVQWRNVYGLNPLSCVDFCQAIVVNRTVFAILEIGPTAMTRNLVRNDVWCLFVTSTVQQSWNSDAVVKSVDMRMFHSSCVIICFILHEIRSAAPAVDERVSHRHRVIKLLIDWLTWLPPVIHRRNVTIDCFRFQCKYSLPVSLWSSTLLAAVVGLILMLTQNFVPSNKLEEIFRNLTV